MTVNNSTSCDEEKAIGAEALTTGLHKLDNFFCLPRISLNLDQDRAYNAAIDYESWRYSRYTIKDLPPFDNAASFGLTMDDVNANIREEIRKLAQYIDSDTPPLFDSYGTLGNTDLDGFEALSNLVDQIRCNLQIIRHDNATLAMDHYVSERVYDVFRSSRRGIRMRYLNSHRTTGHAPKLLDDEIKNMQAYHALIDYVFNSLAWWLLNVAERKSWHSPILALLARWSVKLKLIALDPIRWAERAQATGEAVMRRISNEQRNEERISVEFPSDNAEPERKKVYFPEDMDHDYYYYHWKFYFRESMHTFILRILQNLIAESLNSRRLAAFEVRTLIYKGELDETLRQLTVQQNGTVEMSAGLTNLSRSYRALQLLFSNTRTISQLADKDTNSPERANIHWNINVAKDLNPNVGSLITTRLDDVISTLVPLALIGSSSLVNLLDNPLLWGDYDDECPLAFELSSDSSPKIEFSLSVRPDRHEIPHKIGTRMISSSKSPLITSMKDLCHEVNEWDASNSGPDTAEMVLKRNAMKTLEEYKARKAEMRSWAVTEDSIRVKTTKYSGIVLGIAIGIIGGCIPIPFLVGDKIAGVDPFQFITFGWLLAGAFLVGAKSRYVENWPWHDFLRGQIVCRSVSELSVASRVKKQAVLLYLLHHEYRNPLLFRGPYNSVFRREAATGAQGFNIDVPTAHATVLVAGFIVLEVEEKEQEERKIHTVLQDIREDAPENAEVDLHFFDPVEAVRGAEGGQQKPGYNNKLLLQLVKSSSGVIPNIEVLGLSTADCDFI
ncbi:hypothetical protein BX600DRAFT_491959 [Xylariales sp. PMI_506]|nr:hypothetical protein BX600DRAFT_491959 [Xylariales sp. PMI_506]